MSENVLTIEEAARCLPELVERVHARREAALLVKSGRPLARIVPVTDGEHASESLIAFLGRWRQEHPEPDESLGEAIAESRRALKPPRDPWE
jgi:antitoxin (DNA-binding transcriptional repressor) of toxin-antitoxin stability system